MPRLAAPGHAKPGLRCHSTPSQPAPWRTLPAMLRPASPCLALSCLACGASPCLALASLAPPAMTGRSLECHDAPSDTCGDAPLPAMMRLAQPCLRCDTPPRQTLLFLALPATLRLAAPGNATPCRACLARSLRCGLEVYDALHGARHVRLFAVAKVFMVTRGKMFPIPCRRTFCCRDVLRRFRLVCRRAREDLPRPAC